MTTVVNTSTMKTAAGEARYLSLAKLASSTGADVASLPHTVQILLDDVRSLELEYLDPMTNEWVRSWDTTQAAGQPNRLPIQVRIVLTVPDLYDRHSDRVFATHAVLPISWALNHAMY